MIAGPFIIRHNHAIACRLVRALPRHDPAPDNAILLPGDNAQLHGHVMIFGYGRIGQSVAHLLHQEHIPFIALDLDSARVREAHTAGEPVYYGDATDRGLLDILGLDRARLVIISHGDVEASLKILEYLRRARPELPVMVRTRDESRVEELQKAGAAVVVPETLEAALMIASQSLLMLDVPPPQVVRRIQEQRQGKYRLIGESYPGDTPTGPGGDSGEGHSRSIEIPPASRLIGMPLSEIGLSGVNVIAIVRRGDRRALPPSETRIEANDVLVIHGPLDGLSHAERLILRN